MVRCHPGRLTLALCAESSWHAPRVLLATPVQAVASLLVSAYLYTTSSEPRCASCSRHSMGRCIVMDPCCAALGCGSWITMQCLMGPLQLARGSRRTLLRLCSADDWC